MNRIRTTAIALTATFAAGAIPAAAQDRDYFERQREWAEERRERQRDAQEDAREAWEDARERQEEQLEDYRERLEDRREERREQAEEWAEDRAEAWGQPSGRYRNFRPMRPYDRDWRRPYGWSNQYGYEDDYLEDPYYRDYYSRTRRYESRRYPSRRFRAPQRRFEGPRYDRGVEGVYTPFGYYEEYNDGYFGGPETRLRFGPFRLDIWDD